MPYWAVWRFEKPKPDKDPTKVPYCPANTAVKASSTDPATWTDATTALDVYTRSTGYFSGIMLALKDLPLTAFDLDDCIINGTLHEWAQQFLARCGATYVEVTPSGTGLRVIGMGDGKYIDRKFALVDGASIEVYRHPKRFITVTGKRYNDAPDVLADLNALADEVVAELDAAKQAAGTEKAAKAKAKPKADRQLPPLEDIIKHGRFELWGNDKSRAEYYVVNELLRLGKTDEAIIATFSDANNGIAAHCLSKPEDPRRYIMRTITRARAEQSRAAADGGTDPDGVEIARLAALSAIEYERERVEAAKRMGISRVSVLDRLVQAKRDGDRTSDDKKLQGHALVFDDPEPWDESVDGAKLLDELTAIIHVYVILEDEEAWCVALWIVYTYAADAFRFSPRLGVTSATRGCGKSTLFDLIRTLAFRGQSTANITAAAVFRMIDQYHPTLLIDEADQFLGSKDDLKGLLNSGHKRGDKIWRVLGENQDLRGFDIFGPVAIGQIGMLPNTLIERAIPIVMKRRKKTDPEPEEFSDDKLEPFRVLARKAQRWADDHRIEIGGAKPELPPEVYNRVRDNWRVLKRIAMVAGGEWPNHVDAAALKAIKNNVISDDDLLTLLLSDIYDIEFQYVITETMQYDNGEREERPVYTGEDEIRSEALVDILTKMEGRPWPEMPTRDGKEGKKLTPNKLARLLKPVSVTPDMIGPSWKRVSGYRRECFREAFDRYLPEKVKEAPKHPKKGHTNLTSSHNPMKQGTSDISEPHTAKTECEVRKFKEHYNDRIMCGCEVAKGGQGGSGVNGADKGLEPDLIQRLARDYYERFLAGRDEEAEDVALRRRLADYGVFPEYIKTEFDRVKAAVYAL
jgi:putative DNA primase/helicase